MTPNKLAAARSLRATTEMTLTQIAAQLGVSRTTLVTHLATTRDNDTSEQHNAAKG